MIKTYSSILIAVCIAITLSACDGGLFGTGDGKINPIISTVAPNPSITNPGGSDPTPPPETSAFDNIQVGTNSETPGINLINVSDRDINVFNETTGAYIFSNPVSAGATSNAATIQTGENNLVIRDTTNNTVVSRIYPLNAGASTLTTLIVRNTSNQSLDVVKLSSISISSSPTVAQVRVIQANTSGSTDSDATFMLLPSGENPGGSAVLFKNVNSRNAPEATYQPATPGDYRLVDSLNRFNEIPLTVGAGKIYTLIIQLDTNSPVLISEDDQLSF